MSFLRSSQCDGVLTVVFKSRLNLLSYYHHNCSRSIILALGLCLSAISVAQQQSELGSSVVDNKRALDRSYIHTNSAQMDYFKPQKKQSQATDYYRRTQAQYYSSSNQTPIQAGPVKRSDLKLKQASSKNINKQHFTGLPFLKSLADEHNIELPLPLGVSVARVDITSPFSLDLVDVKFRGESLFELGPDIVSIGEVEALNHTFRVDAYLFPFLNLYGFYGETDGSIPITFSSPIELPILGKPNFTQDIDFEGETLGIGLTLAMGYPVTSNYKIFGVADFNFSRTDLDITDTPVDSLISSYFMGIDSSILGLKYQLWAGAMYHKVDETLDIQVTDLIDVPLLGDISTDIGISNSIGYTPLAGFALRFNEHVSILVEQRFGQRDLFATILEYRF